MTYLIPQQPASGGVTLNSSWRFSTTTAAADPGTRTMRYDNATPANVLNLYINDTTNEGGDASTILGLLGIGNRIYVQQNDDAANATLFELTGPAVDNTGWWTVPVSVVSTLALPVNNKSCVVIMNLGTGDAPGAGGPVPQTELDTSTAATEYDFTGLPAGLTEIHIMLEGISSTMVSTSDQIIQLGDAGGFENSGYVGAISEHLAASKVVQALGDGFALVPNNNDLNAHSMGMILTLKDPANFTWTCIGTGSKGQPSVMVLNGAKSLSAELDRIRLTHSNGTSTFDAGSFNISF